ncbi:hypothetical protein HELRODRAFT_161252 [Helobdella robusta]|uniref:S1 motif domain-containing protein n=1 Tax=Helobdella robusta TaxID=6412 RepID=T1ER94_HELRO|nr:hypothetical protein HELRODRAFT_161252 [Helobdella robusta]ESO02028.1 hypothetical protein HELRODRAFT_161252 [Helobdella robusta]
MDGFIDNRSFDDEDDSGACKRKNESESEIDSDLDDDEYDLIEENLGTKIQRKRKRRRVVDDGEDEKVDQVDDKKNLVNDLFNDGKENSHEGAHLADDLFVSESEGEYEDDDSFIVNDEHPDGKKTKNTEAIQEAFNIFGEKFDYEGMQDKDENDYGNKPTERNKPKTKSSNKQNARFQQIYKQGELEKVQLIDYDQEVRIKISTEKHSTFHRKECFGPELDMKDLWKIFHWDEKWMQLLKRRQTILQQFEQVQQFQSKPVRHLVEDEYLKINQAEEDGMLKVHFYMDHDSYMQKILSFFTKDEYSSTVQEWNKFRTSAVEKALKDILFPLLIKQIKKKLLEEAKDHVIKACCQNLHSLLQVAPYQVDQILQKEKDYRVDESLRILGVATSNDKNEASYCAIIDGSGEITDYLKMTSLATRGYLWSKKEKEAKEQDLFRLKELISCKKPHVVAVAATSMNCLTVVDDIKSILSQLEKIKLVARIKVELVDNDVAKVYANSKKANQDMNNFPNLLRQAISVARRLQDPLLEITQLCNFEEDLLCIRFHQMQNYLNKDELLNNLYQEVVDRVNEVGVDVNRCIAHPHTSSLVKFVSGLGSRKSTYLLKKLGQGRLQNRNELVTRVGIGPKVFVNCVAFLKIHATACQDDYDVDLLDGSRIHPEVYPWARKMAQNALDYDDDNEDAVNDILETPEKLEDLDLDLFAEELKKQGYGDKSITLYDMKAELCDRYKDLRTPFKSATAEEKFNMLTKETPQTFYISKLVCCKVVGIAYRKLRIEELNAAKPVVNKQNGLWQCLFCKKGKFSSSNEVWSHFGDGCCPGKVVGVKTKLDNGVSGFIPIRSISNRHVSDLSDRFKRNTMINCRVSKIIVEKFQAELTTDLTDLGHKWRLPYDLFYDKAAEKDDQKEIDKKRNNAIKAKTTYINRIISHPSYRNVDYHNCEKLMENFEQGDVCIRPSSKGNEHLTVTWKVSNGVFQHIDVREERKANTISLGFVREVMRFKYFKEIAVNLLDYKEVIERDLIEERKRNPSRFPYHFTISKQYPGKFMFSYFPNRSVKHEYVTITPDGLKYRGQDLLDITHIPHVLVDTMHIQLHTLDLPTVYIDKMADKSSDFPGPINRI